MRARPAASSSPGRSRPPGRLKADGAPGSDGEGPGGRGETLRSWRSRTWGCLCAWTTRRAATDLRVPSAAKLFYFIIYYFFLGGGGERGKEERREEVEAERAEEEEEGIKERNTSISFSPLTAP